MLRRYCLLLAALILASATIYLAHQLDYLERLPALPDLAILPGGNSSKARWTGWPEAKTPGEDGYLRRPSWGALSRQGASWTMRANLRKDKKYLVTFPGLGLNNQLIDTMNSIHLAHLSNRIPILNPFWPHGHHYDYIGGTDIPVGDIFDLGHLRAVLQDRPIIEMHELKPTQALPERWQSVIYDGEFPQNISGEALQVGDLIESVWTPEGVESDADFLFGGEEEEELHCWSSWQTIGYDIYPYAYRVNTVLDLTPLPASLFEGGMGSFRPNIPLTAAFLRKSHRTIPPESLNVTEHYNYTAPLAVPDDHLTCIDNCYWFTENTQRFELLDEWRRGLGTWAAVGKHMYWRTEVEQLAVSVGKRLLGVRETQELPPYIGIHIRRGDFTNMEAWELTTARHYGYLAHQILTSIYHNLGIQIKHVLVMTEEADEEWLAPLRAWGFIISDHRNLGLYDPDDTWLPVVVDSVLLGKGKGFLGAHTSTMSILSYLRCQDWNHGIARMTPWPPNFKLDDEWDWSWEPEPLPVLLD